MNTRLKCIDCGESWHPHADVYKRIDDHICLCAGCGFVRLEKAEAALVEAKSLMQTAILDSDEIKSTCGLRCYGVPFDDIDEMKKFIICSDDEPEKGASDGC